MSLDAVKSKASELYASKYALDFRQRLGLRFHNRFQLAIAFAVGTAWKDVFNSLFDATVGSHNRLLTKILLAIIFTLFAALVDMYADEIV